MMTLLCAVVSSAWGQETITFSENGYTNGEAISTVKGSNFTITFDKGTNSSNAPKYYTTGSAIRVYGGNTFIVSSSKNKKIKGIELSFSSGEDTNAITTDVGTYKDGTWTGSSEDITFTIGGTTGHRRISAITVFFVPTPTFYPPAGIFFKKNFGVSIECEDESATIYYTTDGSTPNENSDEFTEAVIPVRETTTIKAIAIDSDGNKSSVATAVYTIIDQEPLANLGELTKLTKDEEGNYYVELEDAVVTYTNGNYAYIDDDIGAIVLYKDGHNLTAGQTFNGTAEVTFQPSNNNPQITDIDLTYCDVEAKEKPEPTPVDDWENGFFNTSLNLYIIVTGAKITHNQDNNKYYITLGGETVELYGQGDASTIVIPDLDDTYTIVGFPTLYNDTKRLQIFEQPKGKNGPGSKINPYTVAQARVAINNNTGTTGVYAKGKVSKIVTAYNSQYGNISYNISDDGKDSSDQLQVYRGKSYNGDNFTSADDIKVGDIVVVYGDLIKYNSIYEFAANNQLVSLERPQTPIISATTSINLAYDATSGEIEYTIVNPKESTNINAATDADWISNFTYSDGKVTFTTTANEGSADRTATITLSYNGAESVTVTVTQRHYVAIYATLPFEFDGGKTDISNTAGLTQEGIDDKDYASSPKLKFNNTDDWLILRFDERPGVLKYTIKGNSFSGGTFTVQTSEDGETYSVLKTYTEFGSSGNESLLEEFNDLGENVRYIKWIYSGKDNGNVGLGGINLAKYTNLKDPELSFEKFAYTASLNEAFTAPTLINPHRLTVTYTSSTESVAKVDENSGEIELISAGETTITATFYGNNIYSEGSASYTLTVTEPETPPVNNDDVFVLADNLFPGDQIIIVNVKEETTEADDESGTETSTTYTYMGLGEQRNNNRAAVEVIANTDGTLNGNDNLSVITLKAATTEKTWWLFDGKGYLYAAGGTKNNYLKTEVEPDTDGKADAAIIISNDGIASIVFQANGTTRNTLRYNSTNNPPIFSCYDPNSQQLPVKIYHKKAALLGDANNDGIVNVTDVMLVVCYTVNGGDGLDINLRNADFNEDGQVNITDAMAILPLAINY